jgi:predicted NBD/HSP70 family sugar kinase
MKRPVIAIDLGGTRIKAALLVGTSVSVDDSIAANSSDGLAAQLPRLERLIHDLCKRAGVSVAESEIDFKVLFESAGRGDRVALAVRDRVVRYWSALAVNVCAAYDPDVIVVGGAVAAAAADFLPAMRDYVNRHAWTTLPPEILPSSLGNHAGLVGIASLFTNPTEYL